MVISLDEKNYKVFYKAEEKLLYFFDITEQIEMESLYYGDRTVIGVLFIDNYDEISQGMDDQTRGQAKQSGNFLCERLGSQIRNLCKTNFLRSFFSRF